MVDPIQSELNRPTTRQEKIIEKVGDFTINDPFRWLEYHDDEVEDWVHRQHQYTVGKLLKLSGRNSLQMRLEELMRVDSFTIPIQKGNRYFYQACGPDRELPVLFVQDNLKNQPRSLVDLNTLSDEYTMTMRGFYVSDDGTLMVYGLTQNNDSHQSLYVMNVDDGTILEDIIPDYLYPIAQVWPARNQAVWAPDNSGFYYTRRPEQVPSGKEQYHQKLYFHVLGTRYQEDRLVFGEFLLEEQIPCPQLSIDGRYLLVTVIDSSQDTPFSDVYVCDLESSHDEFIPIIKGFNALFQAKVHRDRIYFLTNYQAPNWTLASLSLAELQQIKSSQYGVQFRTIIPETSHIIENWELVGDYLLVETIENVISHLYLYDILGHLIQEIVLPGSGCIGAISAAPTGDQVLFSFSSWLMPQSLYRLDLRTQQYASYRQLQVSLDPGLFEVKQVWYQSRDRTQIPMFLLYKKGLKLTGDIPTIIFGYGGFGVVVKPTFNASVIPFLEQRGLYAIANIRGGGEFGTTWHQAGTQNNKQNSFDDFIAAAEWLMSEGYTNPSKLGCIGRSNGGLLVNTVATQRPDLWRAVVASSPVIDMIRFHTSGGGKRWRSDYGSPDCPSHLKTLLSYSPYHNMPEKINAPAILIDVPDRDDRVAPWHGYKMIAQWQTATTSEYPILLRREKNAGHRGRASIAQAILRNTDIWAFLFEQLSVEIEDKN